MAKAGSRPGATSKKKGATKGTGGHGRKALEGKGPTPKAEDRVYHKAHKMKRAAERRAATGTNRKFQTRLGGKRASDELVTCLLYTSPSPRDVEESRMPSSA